MASHIQLLQRCRDAGPKLHFSQKAIWANWVVGRTAAFRVLFRVTAGVDRIWSSWQCRNGSGADDKTCDWRTVCGKCDGWTSSGSSHWKWMIYLNWTWACHHIPPWIANCNCQYPNKCGMVLMANNGQYATVWLWYRLNRYIVWALLHWPAGQHDKWQRFSLSWLNIEGIILEAKPTKMSKGSSSDNFSFYRGLGVGRRIDLDIERPQAHRPRTAVRLVQDRNGGSHRSKIRFVLQRSGPGGRKVYVCLIRWSWMTFQL